MTAPSSSPTTMTPTTAATPSQIFFRRENATRAAYGRTTPRFWRQATGSMSGQVTPKRVWVEERRR